MARLYAYLRWICVGTALIVAVLLGAAAWYTNTDGFRRLIRQQLVAAVNESIHGSVSLERVAGSVWGDVTLYDVRLRHEDEDIVRIPRLKLTYGLLPLLRGELRFSRAEAAEPLVRLTRGANGIWNIEQALMSRSETSAQLSLFVKSLTLSQGTLDLEIAGARPERLRLDRVHLNGRLATGPGTVDFDAGSVSGRLLAREVPELKLNGALSYREKDSASSVAVRGLRLESASSEARVDGELAGLGGGKIALRASLVKLGAADIARYLPQWPAGEALAGSFETEGPIDALQTTFALSALGARAKGEFVAESGAPAGRYRGVVNLAGLDLAKLPALKKLAGVLDGNARFEGEALTLGKLRGAGEFHVRGSRFDSWQIGDLHFQTALRNSVASVAGRLKGALGGADWRGTVTLAKNPRYDFAVAVDRLQIRRLSDDARALDGAVTFRGTLKGSGVTPETVDAQADLQILPSVIGPVKLQKGELAARLAGGRLGISRGYLAAEESSLRAAGEIGLDRNQRGKLEYDFRTANLGRWLALVGRKGAGALTLAGQAEGSLERLTTRGRASVTGLRWDGIAVGGGSADFNLTGVAGRGMPEGRIAARLTGVAEGGVRLKQLETTVTLADTARIEAKVQDEFGRGHRLKAAVDFGATDFRTDLAELSIELPDGTWQLARPATLTKRDGASLQVNDLTLRNNERRASLRGSLALAGPQNFTLSVDGLPLATLAEYFPRPLEASGMLSVEASVSGTAAAPVIAATAKLTGAAIGGQTYGGMAAELSYKNGQAGVALTVQQDAARSLNASGRLPLRLGWQDGWRAEIAGDLDARARSTGLSLAFLNAYSAKSVRNLGGELSFDINLRGPLADPKARGKLRLSGGRFQALPINIGVGQVVAEAELDGNRLTIGSLVARSKNGVLRGSGTVYLNNYRPEKMNVAIVTRRWPVIQTVRYQSEADAKLVLEGSLEAPKISGNVEILEASIRPDLSFLERSSTPIQRDQTIVIVNPPPVEPVSTSANGQNGRVGDSELFDRLALDVNLLLARNGWVRHPDAQVELKGNLRAGKRPGQPLQLVGAGEIIRGWAAFKGRRFDFVRGEVRFTGGDRIDPALDILAQHRLPQYTVDAVVGGTVEKPNLTLRSTPALDQSDILALLVFGKPMKDLNRGEQTSLAQNALDVTSGFAAATIGAAVKEAIGLDSLGFDLGEFDFNGGRIGYGRYLGRRTYVTVNQELSGERGQEVSLEYQITGDWKIESSTSSKGASGVGVSWQKRY